MEAINQKQYQGGTTSKTCTQSSADGHSTQNTDTAARQTHEKSAPIWESSISMNWESRLGLIDAIYPTLRNQLAIGADLEAIKLEGQRQIWAHHIRGTAAARPHQSTHTANCHIRHSAAIHSQSCQQINRRKNSQHLHRAGKCSSSH